MLWMMLVLVRARSHLKVHPDYALEEKHPVLLGSATLRADDFSIESRSKCDGADA